MEHFNIRKATSSDVDAIVELGLLLQQHVEKSNSLGWRMTEKGRKLFKQRIENYLADINTRVLLARAGGETIGFAQGKITSRSDYTPRVVGHISLLYVRKQFRRKGVGRGLMNELCRFFSSNKAEHLSVRYMVGNKEAMGFWTKLGFEPIITTSATYLRKVDSKLKVQGPFPMRRGVVKNDND